MVYIFDENPHSMVFDDRVFLTRDISDDCEFEVVEVDDVDVYLACVGSERLYIMTFAEAEALAARLMNAVTQARVPKPAP